MFWSNRLCTITRHMNNFDIRNKRTSWDDRLQTLEAAPHLKEIRSRI